MSMMPCHFEMEYYACNFYGHICKWQVVEHIMVPCAGFKVDMKKMYVNNVMGIFVNGK